MRGTLSIPLSLVMGTLLVWDPIYSPESYEGEVDFIVSPKYRWLLTEDVIWLAWISIWYDEIATVEDKFSYWHNDEYLPEWFAYEHTAALLTRS